jgi:hypothetical protein
MRFNIPILSFLLFHLILRFNVKKLFSLFFLIPKCYTYFFILLLSVPSLIFHDARYRNKGTPKQIRRTKAVTSTPSNLHILKIQMRDLTSGSVRGHELYSTRSVERFQPLEQSHFLSILPSQRILTKRVK